MLPCDGLSSIASKGLFGPFGKDVVRASGLVMTGGMILSTCRIRLTISRRREGLAKGKVKVRIASSKENFASLRILSIGYVFRGMKSKRCENKNG